MSNFYRVPEKIVHFPNLNGLRFIASLLVIIHHSENVRNMLGLPNMQEDGTIYLFGEQGVVLFFVLSGFLITYLLLAERAQLGTIATGKFYVRRILRIWPLYFFIVLLGLGIMPQLPFFGLPGLSEAALSNLPQKLVLFGLVLPNAALVLYGAVPYLSQAWSIGTEEQFYLFWPWLVKWTGKRTLPGLIGIAAIFIIGKRVIGALHHHTTPGPILHFCYQLLYFFRIECMAVGAVLAAVLFLEHEKWLRWLLARTVQWAVLILIIGLFSWGKELPVLHQELYSILFGILILGLAAAKQPILWLEYSWINYLGKISYGMYMFHMVAIVLILKTMGPWLNHQGSVVWWLLELAAILVTTILLATVSYYGLEKPFLRLKHSFTRVRSQPDAVLPTPES